MILSNALAFLALVFCPKLTNPAPVKNVIGLKRPAPYEIDLQTSDSPATLNLKVNASSTTDDYAEIAFQLWSGAGSGANTFGGSGDSRPSVVLRALNENGSSAAGAFVVGTFTGGSTNSTLTEKFRISSGGNVILSTTGQQLQFTDGNAYIRRNSNDIQFYAYSGFIFSNNTGESFRVDNGGNLNIAAGNNVSASATSTGSFGRVEASRVRGNAIFVESDLAKISKGDNNTIRFDSPTGNVKIGSQNSSFLHFYTDRGKYFFNKRLIVDEGIFSSYNEDLVLQRAETTKLTLGNTITTSAQDFAIADTKTIGTSTFISGITGDGFRIDDNGSDGTLLEIDNIVVRNTQRTHIFQKDVVKATNGILFISDSGVISGSTGTTGTGTVTFEDDKSATFSDDQILLFKDAQDNGTINAVRFQINGSPITGGSVQSGFTKYNVDNVAGNLSNLNVGGTAARISGGTVAIDASSPNSPSVDVNAASGSAVVRMGNLAGITSPRFGTLSNQFGLWASGSAFLRVR